jgi:hypothetical protein
VVKLDLADAEEDPASRAKHEILRFIAGLRARHILSAPQAHLLEDFLLDSSTLLFAAYTVALSAKDSEYLSEILCDIAGSLETDEGRLAVEAQDEVCQVCDQLFIADKVTENQLLYLRHLVLIRECSPYFQRHVTVEKMLAHVHASVLHLMRRKARCIGWF